MPGNGYGIKAVVDAYLRLFHFAIAFPARLM
jgi:hypothetical protein